MPWIIHHIFAQIMRNGFYLLPNTIFYYSWITYLYLEVTINSIFKIQVDQLTSPLVDITLFRNNSLAGYDYAGTTTGY